jgi:hypothetical protein
MPPFRSVIPLGPAPVVEVRVTVGLRGRSAATFRLAGARQWAALVIRSRYGHVLVRSTGRRCRVLSAYGCSVRWSLCHGLVRVRAWREDTEEPGDWASCAYTGASGWAADRLSFSSHGSVTVRAFHVECGPVAPTDPAACRGALRFERAARMLGRDGGRLAVPLAAHAVELWRAGVGTDHPRLAVALNNLAQTLRGAGETLQALALQRQALDLQLRRLGPLHPDTAVSRFNLGRLLAHEARPCEARAHLTEALRAFRTTLGSADWRTRACAAELAALEGAAPTSSSTSGKSVSDSYNGNGMPSPEPGAGHPS